MQPPATENPREAENPRKATGISGFRELLVTGTPGTMASSAIKHPLGGGMRAPGPSQFIKSQPKKISWGHPTHNSVFILILFLQIMDQQNFDPYVKSKDSESGFSIKFI